MTQHETATPCNCTDCQMIDILWGDPLLNPWEKRFIDNLSHFGWHTNYTDKQQSKLSEVFNRIRTLRLSTDA